MLIVNSCPPNEGTPANSRLCEHIFERIRKFIDMLTGNVNVSDALNGYRGPDFKTEVYNLSELFLELHYEDWEPP